MDNNNNNNNVFPIQYKYCRHSYDTSHLVPYKVLLVLLEDVQTSDKKIANLEKKDKKKF